MVDRPLPARAHRRALCGGARRPGGPLPRRHRAGLASAHALGRGAAAAARRGRGARPARRRGRKTEAPHAHARVAGADPGRAHAPPRREGHRRRAVARRGRAHRRLGEAHRGRGLAHVAEGCVERAAAAHRRRAHRARWRRARRCRSHARAGRADMIRALSLALLLVLTAAATIALRAPAAWLGDWMETHGKFRLLDARGTVWHGSALLGISNGRETTLIPGRIEWTVDTLAPQRIAG